jgi:tetratricopeptide (TPR) repeat protein
MLPDPISRAARRLPLLASALLVAAATAAVYGQTLSFPFLPYDDDLYVTANRHVLGGLSAGSARWALTTFHASNWHPLTWLSHMADVSLFGTDAGMHHGVNVLLHGVNALLLLFLLHRWTGAAWRSAAVAALFALHPLHVESVAWVAERKDLLSAFFFLLALGAYGRYAEAPGRVRMAAVAGLFALALASKPSAVTFPFVLLLLDSWPLKRLAPPPGGDGGAAEPFLRRLVPLVAEKVPLFLLSAASCVVTVMAQREGGSLASFRMASPAARVLNALVSYASYLRTAAWPAGLSAYHPYPAAGLPVAQGAAAALLLAGATAAAIRYGRRFPWLPVGWFWYLGTLVPMIGIVQVGGQAMADRYTYLPLVGIFVAVAWGIGEAVDRSAALRRPVAAASTAALLLLAAAAHRQAGFWGNDEALFRQAVENTRDNWFALNCLAYDLDARGEREEAIRRVRESIRIRPDYPVARFNLGAILYRAGRVEESFSAFRDAAALDPRYADAWFGQGMARRAQGRTEEALPPLLEALRLDPENASLLVNLAETEALLGRKEEAARHFGRALALSPGDGRARRGLSAIGRDGSR